MGCAYTGAPRRLHGCRNLGLRYLRLSLVRSFRLNIIGQTRERVDRRMSLLLTRSLLHLHHHPISENAPGKRRSPIGLSSQYRKALMRHNKRLA